MTATSRPLRPVLLLVLVGLAATACGGSGGDDPATATTAAPTTAPAGATASPEACADVAAVRRSIAELDRLDPPEAGKAGLEAAIGNLRASLTALRRSDGGRWATQVAELDGAVAGFQSTVAGADGDSLLGDLPAIVQDLERVDTAWTSLERDLDQACPAP